MIPIAADETLARYINQNGVKPGPKKTIQFIQALKMRATPAICAQDGKGNKATAYVKIFDPCGSWTWYITEFDGADECFGLVLGHERELGYFTISELSTLEGRMGIGLEIDTHFLPTTLDKIK
jgi:hypothetical protein